MIFKGIRIVILFIVSYIIYKIIVKSRLKRKRTVIIFALLLNLLVISFSAAFPIENLFMSFDSPESVFKYVKTGKIEKVINGENSSYIFYKSGFNSYNNYIIPESCNKYKIPNFYTTIRKCSKTISGEGAVYMFNVIGTDDYYLHVWLPNANETSQKVVITHSNNHQVDYNTEHIESSDTKYELIYFTEKKLSDDDYFIVNGQAIKID